MNKLSLSSRLFSEQQCKPNINLFKAAILLNSRLLFRKEHEMGLTEPVAYHLLVMTKMLLSQMDNWTQLFTLPLSHIVAM